MCVSLCTAHSQTAVSRSTCYLMTEASRHRWSGLVARWQLIRTMDIDFLPPIVVSVVLLGVWGCYRLAVRSYRLSDNHKGAGNVNVVQPIVSRTHTSDGHLRRRRHIQNTPTDSPCDVRGPDDATCHSGMGSWLATGDGPAEDDCATTGSGQSDAKADQSITGQDQIPRITVSDLSKGVSSDEWGGQLTDDDGECEGENTETGSRRTATKSSKSSKSSKPTPVSEVRRLLQELNRAREASERSQGWADFLERELLAHINARISVEEQHKKALRKLSATRLVNKRVKHRCERLQEELRELHIGIEQCVGENNNLEPDRKAVGIRRPHANNSAVPRTVDEADIGTNDVEDAEAAIELLEDPQTTEEEAYIEELFAKEVFATDTAGHELFNDIDEAKGFWEKQYTETMQKRTGSTHSRTAGGVAAVVQDGRVNFDRAEIRESRDGSEHSSDPECSVQSKKEMWEERLRIGVRNLPVDANNARGGGGGGGGDATDVQLSAQELSNVQRTKSLWAEKAHRSPSCSPRLPHRSTKSDVNPGSIRLAKQMWEERTTLAPGSDHSPARRLSVGDVSADNSDNEASSQRPITREVLMTSERDCENTSDNVLAESLPSVSQTKRLFEQ
ncbi:hypothetical protein NP493_201g02019 [Ridgeia piscesae]|uniref:Uncharacterized protein n=1 Tax=Ridgeia piscesae TaxID=27915 RepID=A0AAD9P1D8_RIDPI|nr:hypothetical protein NP493_201g02019 [Ridgeia piscesae]